MNHRAGWALIKSTWSAWMQYRGFFFVLAFGWMIPPLVSLFVWLAAAGEGEIQGMTRGVFVGYYLILILVNQLTYAQTNWTVGDMIRVGMINFWLIRPMAPLYHVLANEGAGKVVMMAFAIPAAILLGIILHPELDPTPIQILLFIVSLLLAWAIRFLWGLWLALLAFWTSRSDGLLAVQDALIFLLAGVVAPVQLLPGVTRTLAYFLPFRYMVGFPVEIITGRLSGTELAFGFSVQIVWLAIAFGLARWVWSAGLRRYAAVGG